MAGELWLWIKEKLSAFLAFLGRVLRVLWRYARGLLRGVPGRTWGVAAATLPVVFMLYILVGMAVVQRVDDRMDQTVTVPPGGSHTVAVLAYLVERETKTHNWTPNDPFFLPGWWIDNTPNYQRGMMGALGRFAFELRDQIGRTRGSSVVDPDLEKAAGNLAREPDRWVMDFSTSFLPTTPSDTYFRDAARQLHVYNGRLALGNAVFERRADNLLATLDRIALDLGASSAALDDYIRENSGGWFVDYGSDDLFYRVKGQVYAYALLLTALEQDFAEILSSRELGGLYGELVRSMRAAAVLEPIYVSNGAVDGLMANHLSMQGFYLLRARTQLREVTNILLK